MTEAHVGGAGSLTEAPRLLSVDQYVELLRAHEQVTIPSPDGAGVYEISIRDRTQYGTPLVKFTFGPAGRYPEGYVVMPPWYVNHRGKYVSGNHRGLCDPVAMARVPIGCIVAGRRLYAMSCGSTISSLNTTP